MWWPLLSSCAWSIWTRSLGSLLSSVIMSTASRKCICKIIRYSLVHINVKRRCTPTHLIVFSCENFMQHRDLKPNHILQIMNEFGSAITLVSVLQMFLFFFFFLRGSLSDVKKKSTKEELWDRTRYELYACTKPQNVSNNAVQNLWALYLFSLHISSRLICHLCSVHLNAPWHCTL